MLVLHAKPVCGEPRVRQVQPALRIALVEDNEDFSSTMRTILNLMGHSVSIACNGEEAIALVRRTHPDVVFCDIGLPDLDGYEVARMLRKDSSMKDVRLVALTGYTQAEDVERALDAGFDRHMSKPVTMAAINRVLSTVAHSI